MRVTFEEMRGQFLKVLEGLGFGAEKAAHCATIFARNSLDGVYSHGLNRFPAFVRSVREGLVKIDTEPEVIRSSGCIEYWDGRLSPGMYTASLAMSRAVALAKELGMGAVMVRNTNHWMRGGTYGWQAAEAGCVGICATNTIANMPAWGSADPRLGNNPLVIAIPRDQGAIVLDMAISQFSYGKLQEYELDARELPVPGGYDGAGVLTTNPSAIKASRRTLPIGYWKGAGLSMVLDVLTAALSGGFSVGEITDSGKEYRLSQFFLCIDAAHMDPVVSEHIGEDTRSGRPSEGSDPVSYPGERTLSTRHRNEREGIPVNEKIWNQMQEL
jgi:3-dehydro-L-gulonate 2-dehydrogenase